jgi:hypothetical protein
MATVTLTIHKLAQVSADTDESAFSAILTKLARAGIYRHEAEWVGLGTPTSTLTLGGIDPSVTRERVATVVGEGLEPFYYYPAS